MEGFMNRRNIYILILFMSFIFCALIVAFFEGNLLIRGFIGDVIVIILLYTFIKSFKDVNTKKLSIFVFFLSWFIEISQYFKFIEFIGLSNYRMARVVLGTTFDSKDLIAYTIGVIVIYLFDSNLTTKIKIY